MDSNHDKSLQRALCYHYTIGQTTVNLAFTPRSRKAKVNPNAFGLDVLADKYQIRRLPLWNGRFKISAHAAHHILNAVETLRLKQTPCNRTAVSAGANDG